MKTFKELLIKLRACEPAIDWAADRTIEQVVADCDRGEWLAWLAEEIKLDKRSLVLVGGHIANTGRHLMTDDRSKQAVDVCIAYGEGRATDEELEAAGEAARPAWAAAREASGAAARAAAGEAARADAAAGAVAEAAAGAARSEAAWAAREAAWEAAWEAAHKLAADICRQYIGQAIIEKTNKLLNQ